MGVRIEHPQSIIDGIRYHGDARDPHLAAGRAIGAVEQVRRASAFIVLHVPGRHHRALRDGARRGRHQRLEPEQAQQPVRELAASSSRCALPRATGGDPLGGVDVPARARARRVERRWRHASARPRSA